MSAGRAVSQRWDTAARTLWATSRKSFATCTVLEVLYSAFGGHYLVAALSLAATTFALGYALAESANFADVYLKSPPVYLGVFGVAWVGYWIGNATRRFDAIAKNIRSLFLLSDQNYEKEVLNSIKASLSWKAQILASLILTVNAWWWVYWFSRRGELFWFSPAWSQGPDLVTKNLILDIYAVPISTLIATGAAGIISYSTFVARLTFLEILPNIDLARAKLERLADFGMVTGVAWSVGVSLCILFFRIQLELWTLIGLLLLGGLGFVNIAWPQIVVHRVLSRLKQTLLTEAGRQAYSGWEAFSNEKRVSLFTAAVARGDDSVAQYLKSLSAARTWTYDWGSLATAVATWVLPLATMVINQAIRI